MTSQARKTILAALVSQIETEATGFSLVSYDAQYHHSEGLSPSQFPACIIRDRRGRSDNFVSKTQGMILGLDINIMADGDTTDDELRDLYEAVIDAVNSDITIDGTCVKADWRSSDPPVIWPKDTHKFFDLALDITYWREIA